MADYSDLPKPETGLYLAQPYYQRVSINLAERLMHPDLVKCHPYTHERLRTYREYEAAKELDPHVAQTGLAWNEDGPDGLYVGVSTVHLIDDMGFGEGAGVFWETMIFGDANRITLGGANLHDYQARYYSEGDAVFGHRILVMVITEALVKEGHVVTTLETPAPDPIRARVDAYPHPRLLA